MNMQRKYVYLVVSLLTIAIVLFQEQQTSGTDLKNNKPTSEIKLSDDYLSIEEQATFTINNYQNDDIEKDYTYDLTIEGVSGAYEYSILMTTQSKEGTLIYVEKEKNYLVFTANGNVTFDLKSNESISIDGLPKDKAYTLVQKNKYDGYRVTINDEIKNQTSGITGLATEVTIKNSTAAPTPSESKKQKETDKKQPEQKQEKSQKKDKGPNTAVISSIVVIGVIVSFIIGYLLTKIKIKRFE